MERTNAQRTKDPERLAALLDRQHLVVAVWQMQRCGYSEWAARRAVKTREFDRIYRGVLTVAGTHLSFKGHCMAAVLACGPDAAISHHAAAALHDLRPIPQTAIDVTAPGKRRYDGIRIHVSPLPRQHRTHIDAIPITTLERTYLDYAEQATPRQLTAALEAAQQRQILDLRKLQFVIDNSPGRKGIKSLTAAIEDIDSDPQWTQSRPERDFLELLRTTDLPQPLANRLIEGHLVDFVWPAQRLIVEVDSYDFHTSRAAFEADRVRDAHLQTAGWRVLRVTARRLQTQAQAVVADVRQMLNQ